MASVGAAAHKPSDSYLALELGGGKIEAQWDIALRDLDYALGLDANGDDEITWGELRARHDAIARYALARIQIAADGKPCSAGSPEHLFDEHSDGGYAVLRFRLECPVAAPRSVAIQYELFRDLDPTHRGLLRIQRGGLTLTGVLGEEDRPREFEIEERSPMRALSDYFKEGVWHIWIGLDHVLFLLSLLLPAVLVAGRPGWAPAERFSTAFWDVFRVVTSFTIAHSITLSLAALSVLTLPSRWVESAIALSVVLAALNNLRPVVHRARWLVAFLFGLIHGFGFASVLADLGLPSNALVLALFGFNVGVEAGQLAIVFAFLPLAYALRERWIYRRLIFVGGSAAAAIVAAIWLIERAFDLRLMTAAG